MEAESNSDFFRLFQAENVKGVELKNIHFERKANGKLTLASKSALMQISECLESNYMIFVKVADPSLELEKFCYLEVLRKALLSK